LTLFDYFVGKVLNLRVGFPGNGGGLMALGAVS
jgi:hypothetical protein